VNIEQAFERLMGLNDERWLRHANPVSVYSRYTVLPSIIVAIWSRIWLGPYALVLVALAIAWTFLNPRLFTKPSSMDNWASKAVLGERIWKERASYDVPRNWIVQTRILNLVQVLGIPPLAWGLYTYDIWMTITGFVLMNLGKSWFLDRMVWLFEDHRDDERVRAWLD
jgi:hypothetical protein